MLKRMSGPLCEAVQDQPGTGVVLAELAQSNLLLVPLDQQGRWSSAPTTCSGTCCWRSWNGWNPA